MGDLDYKVVVPARYASQRLPGKPLLEIAGKTMLEHVYNRACQTTATQVVIATDDQRIADAASRFASEVCLTSPDHPTGTDRIAEVVQRYEWCDSEVVVNLQGDEPLMPPALVEQVSHNLHCNPEASIATLCSRLIDPADLDDPAKVKVVFDQRQLALYFSRAAIPHRRDSASEAGHGLVYRHIGLYAYRVAFLKAYQNLPPCGLEVAEQLEQLRALYHGYSIHVEEAAQLPGQDVNTPDDLAMVQSLINGTAG